MSVRSTGGADISSQIIIWLFCMRIYRDILSFKYVLPVTWRIDFVSTPLLFPVGQTMPQYQVVKFSGVDSDKSYTVRVSLLLNGKSIATAQKSLKALAKVQPEIHVEAA